MVEGAIVIAVQAKIQENDIVLCGQPGHEGQQILSEEAAHIESHKAHACVPKQGNAPLQILHSAK